MKIIKKVKLIYIILFSFLLRESLLLISLIANSGSNGFIHGDSQSYINIAQNLYINSKFYNHGHPEIIRTPAYPILLATAKLFGNYILFTIFIQILISCATVYLIYKIALLIFKQNKYAVLSALLYSFEPFSVSYSCLILTETLFTFFLILSSYFLTKYFYNQSYSLLIISAISISILAYVRPVSLYLPLLVFIAMVISILISKANLTKKMIIHSLIYLIISGIVLLPWLLRNGLVANYWKFSAIQDIVFYFFKAPAVLSIKYNIPYPELQKEFGWSNLENYFATHPEQRTWTQAEIIKYMGKEGRRIFFSNLNLYPKIYFKGLFIILLDPGSADILKIINRYPKTGGAANKIMKDGIFKGIIFLAKERTFLFILSIIMGILLLIYYVTFLMGMFNKIKENNNNNIIIFIFLAIIIYLIVVSSGEFAIGRYRHPIMPLICIFSGYFAKSVSNPKSNKIFNIDDATANYEVENKKT
mgnify:CR=1 FL=1